MESHADHLSTEPDYSLLKELEPAKLIVMPDMAPLAIIGLGPIGRHVLEKMATWIPYETQKKRRAVRLLLIDSNDGDRSLDFILPEIISTQLTTAERVKLPRERSDQIEIRDFPWYHQNTESDWGRVDGRLAVFRGLARLWNGFQEIWTDSVPRHIWIVSGAFDPVGSGMLFDIAHVIRLAAQARKQIPFIRWLLAMPNSQWGEDFLSNAAATLRELERLLRHDLDRYYEAYSNASDNIDFRESIQGYAAKEYKASDVSEVFVCTPDEGVYGRQAGDLVINKMSLMLYALAHSNVWESFSKTIPRVQEENVWVSSFGSTAIYLPFQELQQLVRARICRDVLIDQKVGVFPKRRAAAGPSEQDAVSLLIKSRHPFLTYVGRASQHSVGLSSYPPDADADRVLRRFLRLELQELVESTSGKNDLALCDSLLRGLEQLLMATPLSDEMVQPLRDVVSQAQNELRNWWRDQSKFSNYIQGRVDEARDRLHKSLELLGARCVIDDSFADVCYRKITSDKRNIHQEIRARLCWAWVIDDESLHLRLDVVRPGQESFTRPSRHAYGEEHFVDIWQATSEVVEARTSETDQWTSGMLFSESVPDAPSVQKDVAICLGSSREGKDVDSTCIAYQVSGDPTFLSHDWWPHGIKPISILEGTRYMGILLQTQTPIMLDRIALMGEYQKAYQRDTRRQWKHLFPAEQLAARIELNAFRAAQAQHAVSSQRGANPVLHARLSVRTVSALQWERKARLFRDAWLIDLLEPKKDAGIYKILVGDILCEIAGRDLLEALYNFVTKKYRMPDGIREEALLDRLQSLVERRRKTITAKLKKGTNWSDVNSKDLEWTIFAFGWSGE